jgi:hypothetical protein
VALGFWRFRTEGLYEKAGGYMVHPAGKVHWDGTREKGAVTQIIGYGPSGNSFVKPDEPQFGKTN